MNSKEENHSHTYDVFLLLNQTMSELSAEDLLTVKEKLGVLLRVVTADIEKGRGTRAES